MLELVDAAYFSPSTGKVCAMQLPDGSMLPVLVDSVNVKSQYRNPYAPEQQRLPFIVTLTAQQTTAFIEGPCAIDLEQRGRLEEVYVLRVAPLGRDPAGAYFQIVFS
ncbi:DUF6916 family protein [Collimonas sp.]|jgi:hypothetical protein|uniref:DUF6916 family protein n=1 Tax=Collimonas sp. TaxID=1963772 RepID=UPI002BC1CCBD|nr:hypothetical protein [Collimonas sp.]HWW04668.1 hypothetical protein [Collimonas sp.]